MTPVFMTNSANSFVGIVKMANLLSIFDLNFIKYFFIFGIFKLKYFLFIYLTNTDQLTAFLVTELSVYYCLA
jgi:hypothetical protein